MIKRDRNYALTLAFQQREESLVETLTVKYPFTMEFDISRNTLQSTNEGTIRLYNLSGINRGKIVKDEFPSDLHIGVQVIAGYGDTLPIIFKGNVWNAFSVREGNNFVTTIRGFDGGEALIKAKMNQAFESGTPTQQIIGEVNKSFAQYQVTPGAIGDFSDTLKRGNSVSGNSGDIASTLTKGGFFIDNGKAYYLNDDEVIDGALSTIDASTGLLGTPVIEKTLLRIEVLFEPRLVIGQLIELKSSTAKNMSGPYKVISVKHRGMISGSVCGNAVTSLGLWKGLGKTFRRVQNQ